MIDRWRPAVAAAWPVLFNAGSLMGSIVVNSALGFVYWWVAARSFAAADVGFAAAAISAMTLLGTLGVLGLGTLLIGELPRRRRERGSLITTSVGAAAIAGGALGVGFAVVADWISPELASLGDSLDHVALFAAGAALTAATLVIDQAMIGLLRGGVQLARNAIFGIGKLVALVVVALGVAGATGLAIYGTWVFGAALATLAIGAWLAYLAGGPRSAHLPHPRHLRGLGRAAVAHHGLNVALQATGMIMPLIVTAVLSTTANAYFYTASMVAYLVYIGPGTLATVFYAIGSSEPTAIVRRLRLTLSLGVVVAILGNLMLLVAGGWILGLFGPDYATEAIVPLQLLGLQAFTFIVREHYVAIHRLEGHPARAVPLVIAGSLLKISFAAFGAALGGLTGLALALLIAAVFEAIPMAPAVYRAAVGDAHRAPAGSAA